jgi:hypothetical protein
MWKMMTTCVNMHNMIVEDEHVTTSIPRLGNFRVVWLRHSPGGGTVHVCASLDILNTIDAACRHKGRRAPLL